MSNSISIIYGNNIANNMDYGIWAYECNGSMIYHNNFINNGLQACMHASTFVWDGGYPSGGNYWSDYTGVDTNFDGIGDTPYIIDENNQDNYPLMDPVDVGTLHSVALLSTHTTDPASADGYESLLGTRGVAIAFMICVVAISIVYVKPGKRLRVYFSKTDKLLFAATSLSTLYRAKRITIFHFTFLSSLRFNSLNRASYSSSFLKRLA